MTLKEAAQVYVDLIHLEESLEPDQHQAKQEVTALRSKYHDQVTQMLRLAGISCTDRFEAAQRAFDLVGVDARNRVRIYTTVNAGPIRESSNPKTVAPDRIDELKIDDRTPPPKWGEDPLTAFLGVAYQNAWATFHNLKDEYNRLRKIESLFKKATTVLDNKPEALIPITLLFRAHSAFMTGAGLAMSAQLREAYLINRGCLEDSLYAWHLYKNPDLGMVWLGRHKDESSRKQSQFSIRQIIGNLKADNKAIGEPIEQLYERTIDYGAHPNQRAVLSNMEMIRTEDGYQFNNFYFTGSEVARLFALKTSAQVGIGVMAIFTLIFKTRFEIVGLSQEIESAKQGL